MYKFKGLDKVTLVEAKQILGDFSLRSYFFVKNSDSKFISVLLPFKIYDSIFVYKSFEVNWHLSVPCRFWRGI